MRKKRSLSHSHLLFAATLALLGAVSVRAQQSSVPPGTAPGRDAGPAVGFSTKLPPITTTERLCDPRHWIARRATPQPPQNPVCPSVTDFVGRPLFPLEVRTKIPDQPFYCRYDWKASGYGSSQPPSLVTAAKLFRSVSALVGPVPACQVMAPLGSPSLAGWTGALYYSELRNQTGSSGLRYPEGAQQVRLAVLDTAPTGTGAPAPPALGASQHGFSVARIAANLTCSAEKPTACVAAVTTRLALPRTLVGSEPAPGETHDGGFGSPGDLAEAIARETLAWNPSGGAPSQHLILNLSVGWDPDELHAVAPPFDGEELNTEEAAVYSALVYAAQQGALVIAAAGNGNGGVKPGHGGVWPAAWYAAPPSLPEGSGSTPLLWAIGGVDHANRLLANARAGALPPLVTYADHAAVPLGDGQWTSPLTGTSAAAVVASSIAAFVWSQQPSLSAAQVMSQLANSGEDIGKTAQLFRQSGVQVASNRLGATTQLAERASSPSLPRVKRLRFGPAPAVSPSSAVLSTAAATFTTNKLVCGTATPITSGCGSGSVRSCLQSTTATVSGACLLPSAHASVNATPWVLTQPGGDNCPTCTLSAGPPTQMPPGGGGKDGSSNQRRAASAPDTSTSVPPPGGWDLYLEIPDAWPDGICPTSLLVEAETSDGSPQQSIWLQVSNTALCPGHSLIVSGLQFPADVASAAVSFLVNNGASLERSPLYVVSRQ